MREHVSTSRFSSRATLNRGHRHGGVIAFPLAAGLLYSLLRSPEIAALAVCGSSALIAVNALLLKRLQLTDTVDTSATDWRAIEQGIPVVRA